MNPRVIAVYRSKKIEEGPSQRWERVMMMIDIYFCIISKLWKKIFIKNEANNSLWICLIDWSRSEKPNRWWSGQWSWKITSIDLESRDFSGTGDFYSSLARKVLKILLERRLIVFVSNFNNVFEQIIKQSHLTLRW